MLEDDRAEFALQRAGYRRQLAQDEEVRALDRAVIEASDRLGYSYVWDWMGLPVIQMPADVVAMQEIVWAHRPDVVIETGVARGGSLVMLASLMLMASGEARVIGVDIEIRPHNRAAIEGHSMAPHIRLVEGSSTSEDTLVQVRTLAAGGSRVMVVLDSDHTHAHVLSELRSYADLVTPGQCLVVADTVVEDLPRQDHRPRAWGPGDNPMTAVRAFLEERADFEPAEEINSKLLMSSSRGGYLRRRG